MIRVGTLCWDQRSWHDFFQNLENQQTVVNFSYFSARKVPGEVPERRCSETNKTDNSYTLGQLFGPEFRTNINCENMKICTDNLFFLDQVLVGGRSGPIVLRPIYFCFYGSSAILFLSKKELANGDGFKETTRSNFLIPHNLQEDLRLITGDIKFHHHLATKMYNLL